MRSEDPRPAKNPPCTTDEYLETLTRNGLLATAAEFAAVCRVAKRLPGCQQQKAATAPSFITHITSPAAVLWTAFKRSDFEGRRCEGGLAGQARRVKRSGSRLRKFVSPFYLSATNPRRKSWSVRSSPGTARARKPQGAYCRPGNSHRGRDPHRSQCYPPSNSSPRNNPGPVRPLRNRSR